MTPKTKNTLAWVLSILGAAGYVMAGLPKVLGQAAASFEGWGYPGWFSYLVGATEMSGGIGLLIPKLAKWAAIGLILVMLGAVYTEATNSGLAVRPLPWMVLAGLVAWLRWDA